IVHVNYRIGKLELDVVAKDGDQWVFVEVKTRRAGGEFRPEDGMHRRKVANLFKAADRFIEKYDLWNEIVRFDFVAVELDACGHSIAHFPDAFRRDDTLPDVPSDKRRSAR
ncbi:MAG: YraN family protein, partial [Bacteroidia bacterium]|nr:YraN family protein [Bacteroidia bacterium]